MNMQQAVPYNDYNLNEQTLDFINYLGKTMPDGTVYTTTELIELFQQSSFYSEVVTSYHKSAMTKSISYAVTRSSYWTRIKRGVNERRSNSELQSEKILDKNSKRPRKYIATRKSHSTVNIDLKAYSINVVTDSPFRKELIDFLASNMFDVIMIKKNIKDDSLRHYHFTKGSGEDLYFLTESFYKQKNLSSFKHHISDFITEEAKDIILSGQTRNNLIFEHMVPKNLYLSVIASSALEGTLTKEMVHDLFNKYLYVCTIAKKSENNKLPGTSMGLEWNQKDPFFRYESACIKFYPNIFNKLYFS
ncbi:hypothetical protein V7152_18875 [Neobacillus drentensis]|uniref:hypothetical protein n=1 Tax=Neobacillus drentensis TaxID=220684 RepID=UPI0030003937